MPVKLKALALLLLDKSESENERVEQEYWVRPWLANRPQFGAYHLLFLELKKDGKLFKEFLRMDEGQFDFLVGKRTVKIIKEDTVMRPCIKPHEIVCVALPYLASGEVDINVCSTVIELLGPDRLNTPRSKEKWLEISNKFEERWNFPNGLGAVDGNSPAIQDLIIETIREQTV